MYVWQSFIGCEVASEQFGDISENCFMLGRGFFEAGYFLDQGGDEG